MKHGRLFGILLSALSMIVVMTVANSTPVSALSASNDFSIQVTPSPLVATLKPGETTSLELKIYNNSSSATELGIDTRSFGINDTTGEVKVDDSAPAEIADWISFSADTFTIQPGQWYTQRVTISLPKSTGFSYHFAIVISQKNVPVPLESTRVIRGSVAVFTLINVDRAGSVRKLDAVELEADKKIYEYLPAKISVRFKNTGNSIIQPYGNIFVQRSDNDASPIATLPVNENKGYILPGSVRTLTTKWEDGFPMIETDSNGTTHEVWDWSKINKFRFGRYTVKLVGVYNDGQRDVPIESEITFWILPWKILLGLLIVLVLVGLGIWTIGRRAYSGAAHKLHSLRKK